MVGDKIEFQNAGGAWSPMIYACTYDPNTKKAIDTMVQEGRLP